MVYGTLCRLRVYAELGVRSSRLEGEEDVRRSVASRLGERRCGEGEHALLQGQVGVEVDLGGLHALVAEPESDDRGVDPAGEQLHGVGVAEDVGSDRLGVQ